MGNAGLLALFSAAIVLGALGGALIPVLSGTGHRLAVFLAFAAGVMFGAAFFHMLPEALHGGGYVVLSWVPLGFVALFLLERYVLVHACEEPPDCEEHSHPGALGLTAFLGLSAHTLFDGVALGSSTMAGVGFMAFVAIAAHKVPSSLSLASILLTEKWSRRMVMLLALLFGLMVPVGVLLYLGLDRVAHIEGFAPGALAFSAGTFLYIAVSDLLPHVNRHLKEGRFGHLAGMALGLAAMFALTFVTGHEHLAH